MKAKYFTYFLTVCSIILPQVILAQSNYVNHISSNKIEMVVNKADGSVIAIDVDEIDQIFFREKEDNDTIERESLPDYLLEEYQKLLMKPGRQQERMVLSFFMPTTYIYHTQEVAIMSKN